MMVDTGTRQAEVHVRIYSDGRNEDHKQSFISWLVAVITLTIYTGWMHILIGLTLASFFSRTCLVLLIAIWSTVFLPPKPVLWGAFGKSWMFQTWREYFHFSYLNEANIDFDKKYMYIGVPHGVFPLSQLLAGTLCQAIWPDFSIYSVAASSVYSIPFWRHFIAWLGAVPATPGNFKRVLRKGSLAVFVGGIAEMYMQHKHKELIKLLDRKGFVRIAVEEGLDGGMIPVYHFGNTQVFDYWPQLFEKFARKNRIAMGFLVGWWGTPVPRGWDGAVPYINNQRWVPSTERAAPPPPPRQQPQQQHMTDATQQQQQARAVHQQQPATASQCLLNNIPGATGVVPTVMAAA